jgi:hypothetical protein
MEEMIHFYGTVLGCLVERELSPEFGLVQFRVGAQLERKPSDFLN